MDFSFRRVVTGHDAQGRAVVQIDALSDNELRGRTGVRAQAIWSTDGWPIDNLDPRDGATLDRGHGKPDATRFRVIEYMPGCAPRMHRTETIDYAIVLSGKIDMELDDTTTTLVAGDLLVQRGTIHNWINRYEEPCVIAFILICAEPVKVDGKTLGDAG